MRGTYGVDSELLFTTLIGQRLPAESRAIAWSAYTLHGEADSALTAIVMNARQGADTMRLERNVAYRCADGWHVSIDLRDKATLVQLLATLNSTPGLADARAESAVKRAPRVTTDADLAARGDRAVVSLCTGETADRPQQQEAKSQNTEITDGLNQHG